MLIGFVSDEYYAALADVAFEFRSSDGDRVAIRSTASGAVLAHLPPGDYEVSLARPGFGSKRVSLRLPVSSPHHFRLLSDRLLGYAWPKFGRSGDSIQFRMHTVEPYKLTLWRYGLLKECVKNVGWYDNHGPRAAMQTVPDGFFAETGVKWDAGFGTVHGQRITAPERSGLYYFHAKGESGAFFSFPLVVAPAKPKAKVAVLASTNNWNAYNPFGGRSNYIMASRAIDEPIVNSKSDLPRYRMSDYGEWKSAPVFEPLSFDRPEPYNLVPEHMQCTDPIEGRQACHLAPSEWRLLGWLEREGIEYDLYSDQQLHDGTLPLDAYQILILNTHPEYWSVDMYRKTKSWVFERGGRLMYLGGNGINCAIEYLDGGKAIRCLNAWPEGKESRFHAAEESEANLLGVVFSDAGAMTSAPYEVTDPNHWIFAGTGLRKGDRFGTKILHQRYGDGASGHETDKISPSSPKQARVLAKGLNLDDGGAQIVCFETPGGGMVFSAGSITYPTALLCDDLTSKITKNVLNKFLV
ncbi:MAG: carboxypeptidase-like regulatory domain-containing protein [Planctomycetes bacterium]|nr:carboxypeptidase-like regulatory domain-containing protein [Planctomycetota bacterium]